MEFLTPKGWPHNSRPQWKLGKSRVTTPFVLVLCADRELYPRDEN